MARLSPPRRLVLGLPLALILLVGLGAGLARRISCRTALRHPWVDRIVWLGFRIGQGGVVRAVTGLRGGAGPVRRAVRGAYRMVARG